MTSKNDITGDAIATKPATNAYRDNFERIFNKTKVMPPAVEPGYSGGCTHDCIQGRDCRCKP